MWNYLEKGAGEPLVLLHGIGMSSRAWLPVMDNLAKHRRVIAFDTAGFGASPQLPEGKSPTTVNVTLELQQQLAHLGIHEPVDIVGNSMGGWMALEAARLGFAKSVVAISPAGLWLSPPKRARYVFFNMRTITRRYPKFVMWLLRKPLLREILMAIPMTTGCRNMPAEEAIASALNFANAPGFIETFESATRFEGGNEIDVPITIAFGTHDFLIPFSSRLTEELPDHVRWVEPKGWGHVPMWKDPKGVCSLILSKNK